MTITEEKTGTTIPPMFTPFTLKGMTLPNRVAVSPMCMYSATDGTVDDFHLVHLGSRAVGGAGLIITEMTDVSPEGRISLGCAGMYKPEHVAPWKRVVDFIHDETDSKIAIQLGHAGRKGSEPLAWERGKGGMGDKAWQTLAPSAIPFSENGPVPKEMDQADIDKVRDDFVRAAGWSDEAGFDMIEFHMGHGYLLSSFISPLSNRRDDDYGGDLEGRMRLPLEVLTAVRKVWPADKPLSARISAVDWQEGGTTIEDAIALSRMLNDAGLDIIDVSTGNVTSTRRPVMEGLFQTPFSEQIRAETGIPTMTVGNITTHEDVNAVIESGRADICVLAKWHLYDPYFVRHAARDLGYDGFLWPKQYLNVLRMQAF